MNPVNESKTKCITERLYKKSNEHDVTYGFHVLAPLSRPVLLRNVNYTYNVANFKLIYLKTKKIRQHKTIIQLSPSLAHDVINFCLYGLPFDHIPWIFSRKCGCCLLLPNSGYQWCGRNTALHTFLPVATNYRVFPITCGINSMALMLSTNSKARVDCEAFEWQAFQTLSLSFVCTVRVLEP